LAEDAQLDDPMLRPLRVTPLDAWHRRQGARMAAFAGYSLPVQYRGVIAEHRHCRAGAALFDVSHMGQATLSGTAAAAALERLVPGEMLELKPGRQRYTLLTNEAGGIIDDLMVARLGGERLFLVVNAARKAVDFAHITAALPAAVRLTPLEDRALLALQGPLAASVLSRFCGEAAGLAFLSVMEATLAGMPVVISRSGYTGEDGFEISVPADAAERLAQLLVEQPEVAPAGLGARDSLRLEAGLCLYGNDIDELTTPLEAGLGWVVGKRRRAAWDFPGATVIRDQFEYGCARLRVGLRPEGRTPARGGAAIVADDGTAAGIVTSGGFAPTLNRPIAMGYVRRDLSGPGTGVHLIVRGKRHAATVVRLPFVPHRYTR
jgi:aminomethyltransferase